MSGPLRVGIVGCGFATQTRHLPAMARTGSAEVVALADTDEARLREVAGTWRVDARYGDAATLAVDPNVEAVAVCVPAALHLDAAMPAFEAGRHVLVEKPLALELRHADRLVERALQAGVTATVGFNLRSHRLAREARQLVRDGALGRVLAVRSLYSDPVVDRPGLPPWRRNRKAGGGSVLEKGVHHFDLWRFFLEDEVRSVHALARSERGEDQMVAVNGVTEQGTLLSAVLLDSSCVANEMTFLGEKAGLVVDFYRSDGLELRTLEDLPGAPATRVRRLRSVLEQLAGNAGELTRGGAFDTSYDAQWRAFAKSVRTGREPACTLEDGRRALLVALAVLESADSGRPVDLADVDAGALRVGDAT